MAFTIMMEWLRWSCVIRRAASAHMEGRHQVDLAAVWPGGAANGLAVRGGLRHLAAPLARRPARRVPDRPGCRGLGLVRQASRGARLLPGGLRSRAMIVRHPREQLAEGVTEDAA